ncbi:acyl-CoA dehydrogenase family protein [Peribacillus asahii]|uniref:acyl-CoA dehydrogenase family protein n=1 Tax=Peribacillus asahii TaxID=228899 RepID=UPI002079549B|nr:acyl-CoA dehydrogenase family protein [Peribacillus asahii]USK72489.1 acyl-CoA/acyl-ACP dehydrogenase [Peribacillus asahii]
MLLKPELENIKKILSSILCEFTEDAEQSSKRDREELSKEIVERLKQAVDGYGLHGIGAKKEWGGTELSLLDRTILVEEASKHRFGLYHPAADVFGGGFPSFLTECTNKQQESFVKPAMKTGKGCFVAVWEEAEDNDLGKLTTSAIRDQDRWIINGQKTYIQNLDTSGFGVILVNCQLESGELKPTLFLLDSVEQLEKKDTTLIDVHSTHSIIFNDVRIYDNQRIGAIGDGTRFIKQWLAESQVLLAAKCLGVSVQAIEYGKAFAKKRITRGKPLAEFPTIRSMIGKALISLQSARLMVQDAAKKVDKKDEDWELIAQMAKLQATETASKIVDDVLQIHGGAGFAGDLPIERWYKEIRIARVNHLKSETIIENAASKVL